jgi:elongation of very long chain fatty acids protein 4
LPFYVSAQHNFGIGLVPNAKIEFWVLIYYFCKILDLGDTVFMVMEKKSRQLSLLHVWHHASIIPLFAFYLSTGRAAGSISALPVLNSLIHVLMYAHYLIMTLAPKIRAWWKPLLTGSQIGQHLTLMVYMVLNFLYGRPEDCGPEVFVSGMLWGLSILALFGNFYVQQYIVGKAKKKER